MAIPERVRGRGHRTANRLEAGAGVGSREDLQLHLGAGSESGNELPLSGVELADWTCAGEGVASHFLASSAASRLSINFPSCSQGRGGDVSAPCKGRKFSPEPPALSFPAGPYWNQGHERDSAFLQSIYTGKYIHMS